MPGCGKEEVLVVAKDLGLSIVRMGDVVREVAQRRGLPITDAAVGGMAQAEREAHGFGIWAERTLPRIYGDRVVVEGLRGRVELEVFRKAFGEGLVVIAVHASPKTRHERMLRRKRSDDALTIEAGQGRGPPGRGGGTGGGHADARPRRGEETGLGGGRGRGRRG